MSVRNVVIFVSFFYIVVAFHLTCLALCAVRWQGIVKRKAYRARYYIACKASRSTRRISSAFCFYFGKFPITYQRVEVTIVLPFFVENIYFFLLSIIFKAKDKFLVLYFVFYRDCSPFVSIRRIIGYSRIYNPIISRIIVILWSVFALRTF